MATVTFELDDAIYNKAVELLAGQSMPNYLKAATEAMVATVATGIIPEMTPDMVTHIHRILDRAKLPDANSIHERVVEAGKVAAAHTPEEDFHVDIQKAQDVMEFMANWINNPDTKPALLAAEKDAKNAIMGLILTGIHEGIFPNKAYATTRIREKLFSAFYMGFYQAWRQSP